MKAPQQGRSVTKYLLENHQIEAKPGEKVECPFCNHVTLSIKPDDTFAKCFNPECEQLIRPDRIDLPEEQILAAAHDKLFAGFRKAFLSHTDDRSRNAYTFLRDERGIHPDVLRDARLGEVRLSAEEKAEIIGPIQMEIESLAKRVEAAIAGNKHDEERRLSRAKKTLEGAVAKLNNCLDGCDGWIAFFYVDRRYQIVSIKLREPYSKKIRHYKPLPHSGIFGIDMLSGHSGKVTEHPSALVFEGEVNLLSLQSLSVRYAESNNVLPTYQPACAIGGVLTADYETVKAFCRTPTIIYDNDVSGGGKRLVTRAQRFMNVWAVTTPDTPSDTDSYLRSFGGDNSQAWHSFQELLGRKEFFERHYDAVAEEVYRLRQRSGPKEFEMFNDVAEDICLDLSERSNLHHDNRDAYVFLKAEKVLVIIDREDELFIKVVARYGLLRTEKIFNFVVEFLRVYTHKTGTLTAIQRVALYDPERFILHLFNHKNMIYQISVEKVELVDNGTDGILFLGTQNAEPFEILTDSTSTTNRLDDLLISKVNFASDHLDRYQQRLLLILWILSLFFRSVMPTKVIAAFIGPKGSSKSFTLKKLGRILFGSRFDLTPLGDKSDDFDATVTNSWLVCLDNADTVCKWLADRLCTLATGGTVKRRKYYTTNTMVEYPTDCAVAITSRTPEFRRDDVNDRLLLFKTERIGSFLAEKKLLAEISKYRNELMGELVTWLQEVVKALSQQRDYEKASSFRMADFGDFAMKVARSTGIEPEMTKLFETLARSQTMFTLEGEPMAHLLWEWVQTNAGREVSNVVLCEELAKLAEKKKVLFPYSGNVNGFSQKMKNLRANLEEFFVITEVLKPGNCRRFTFTLKSDAVVEI